MNDFGGVDDLYRDFILDHYRHPRNAGTLENPDATFEDNNPLCGDRIRMDVRIADDRIEDVRFNGRGCAISQASASLLTEAVKGKTVAEVSAEWTSAALAPHRAFEGNRPTNVMLLDPKGGRPTRVRIDRTGGERSRVAKRSGTPID